METIRHILLADWDPIGIRDVPQAQDEYDSYVPGIAALLRAGADVDRIASHLLRIEEDMALIPDPERARRVALKLRAA